MTSRAAASSSRTTKPPGTRTSVPARCLPAASRDRATKRNSTSYSTAAVSLSSGSARRAGLPVVAAATLPSSFTWAPGSVR